VKAAARPLLVEVAALVDRPGERRELVIDVVLDDLALSSARVPGGAEVHVDLVLEAILGGLTATGTVRAPWAGACRRCLEPVTEVLEAEVREVYSDAPDLDDPDILSFEGTRIDLEPVVREAVLLSLPIAPLCREDCPGPAPEAFPARQATEPVGEGDAPRDPRWAALDGLTFDE
jgi:uncharacterized protein